MEGFLAAVLLAVLIVFGIIIPLSHDASERDRYNRWSAQCTKDGGVVSETEKHFWTTRYECVKDGKFINQVD
jgi:hypothetical protein